jgi:hypothetical protein
MHSDLRHTSLNAGFMLGDGSFNSSPQKRQEVAAYYSHVLPAWYGSALHFVQKFLPHSGQRILNCAMCSAAALDITLPLSSLAL